MSNKKKTVCKINMCNGCMACASLCPTGSIEIKDELKAMNAYIDLDRCLNCNACKSVCPNENMPLLKSTNQIVQGWNNDSERKYSSSGGVVLAIAKAFVESGGAVCSCIFKEDFIFKIAKNLDELKQFTGSKYVKSNPEEVYNLIKKQIKTSKVLFIGLPCQVGAVKNYFKDNENLYTIDLICHGTPSKLILKKFLTDKNIEIKKINKISFRKKQKYGLEINGIRIAKPGTIDDYVYSFLRGYTYTENCYSCRFATIERIGDITVGDSWGSELESEKENGISLMLIQTEKGKALIQESNLSIYDVNAERAIKSNKQLMYPTKMSKKRKIYFKLFEKNKKYNDIVFLAEPLTTIKRRIKSLFL